MLGKLAGNAATGLLKPVISAVMSITDAKERTKQVKEWSRVYCEIAASSWRPIIANAICGAIILWVLCAAALFLANLWGVVFQSVWVLSTWIPDTKSMELSPLDRLWGRWLEVGKIIFGFAGLFLTTYAGGRSLEKFGSGEGVGKVGGMLGKAGSLITGRRAKPVVIDEQVNTPENPIQDRFEQGLDIPPRFSAVVPVSKSNSINMPSLVAEIKREEGHRDHIYKDSLGYLTFGYGHLVTKHDPEHGFPEGTKVRQSRIDSAFRDDLNGAIEDARRVVVSFERLPTVAKHVVISMSFQLGAPKLSKFKNMIAALNAGDFNTAALEAMDSKAARQTRKRWLRHAEALQSLSATSFA